MRTTRKRKIPIFLFLFLVVTVVGATGWILSQELLTYERQAHWFHSIASRMTFTQEEGTATKAFKGPSGPYDRRLGYASLSVFTCNLIKKGFHISGQARVSDEMWNLSRHKLFPPYREKTQTGLRIVDRNGNIIFYHPYPARTFRSFSDIPPIIVEILLYLENRKLLDKQRPMMNPSVEWDRLARAVMEKTIQWIHPHRSAIGGSTLATQMEKFRHSDNGITDSVKEKIKQMISASLRAYREGVNTIDARKRIVLDYLNSIPMAAFPGYGEVHGLGDGLYVWYGTNFNSIRKVLRISDKKADSNMLDEKALIIKQVLSLFIAQRRPSVFLLRHRKALNKKCNHYLRLLAAQGILSQELRDRSLLLPLPFRNAPPSLAQTSLVERKAANPIRIDLLSLTGVQQLYDLDRMDLSVKTTLDLPTQIAVTREIFKLKDSQWLAKMGLTGFRLLDKGDPRKVVTSIVLYQSTERGNLLRLETDNYERALNINRGVKLDLGSTAKLRTLVHYLEIIESLYNKYNSRSPQTLRCLEIPYEDRLSKWAITYLLKNEKRGLEAMLEASLSRSYSASPKESFFTGSGMHTFENFDDKDDNRILTVREGFTHSVNLVFIRLMKDIVRYHIHQDSNAEEMLQAKTHPLRREYLVKFADLEGKIFLKKFYSKYKGRSPEHAFHLLLKSIRPILYRLALVYRYVHPKNDLASFIAFLRKNFPESEFAEATIQSTYKRCAPESFTLTDIGFLSQVHPLELWLVAYMQKQEKHKLSRLIQAGYKARQETYTWLFHPSQKPAQDRRIRILLEREAFCDIHQAWQRLGYPFDTLVPSYATALGSSADRPESLAELIGILVNNGYRMPMIRTEEIEAADQTPYEVSFSRQSLSGKRVLSPEIAVCVKSLLFDIVEKGTAIRGSHSFVRADGTVIPLGGKTGTGDHRYEIYGKDGVLISSKAMNRAAAFTFMIGDRYFGTITTFVPGPDAEQYRFTSSFPVAILKALAPNLTHLLDP